MRWVPAVLYMGGIFMVSSIPDIGALPGGVSDKSWHFLAYAGLGVLVTHALSRGRPTRLPWPRVLLAILLATLYGICDELHQSLVPGRMADAADVVADAIGAAAGSALLFAAVEARAWGILGSRPPRADPS
jgi:VanZ family protein